MASQETNGRLRQIAVWWALMSEQERQVIYDLTKLLTVSPDPNDATALGAVARALTPEDPTNARATL